MNVPDSAGSDAVKTRAGPARQYGITLIEQIMVLAITATLVSVAVPSLHKMLSRNRLQVAQTDFMAALHHARANAANTGLRTVFCPSRDSLSCSDEDRWDSGWLIGRDGDHDDQPDHRPLYTNGGYRDRVHVVSSRGRHIVRFRADGSARGSNLTLVFCQPHKSAKALSVVVSNSGRVRGATASAKQAAACAASK